MNKKSIFKGCGTAIPTPFTKDGINFNELANLIEFQISEKADAIIVCGTTGESSTMTLAEKKEKIKFTVDAVHGRIPVIAGTGSNNTSASIELSTTAEKLGVDGVLLVTPYYNKTTQEGLIAHYTAIANKIDIPIILYNVPSRTGLNILPETCAILAKVPNIVAIKEASGNLSQVAKIAYLCGDSLDIYSGNDDQILPILSLGGIGVISVLSNIEPYFVHKMVYDFIEGNMQDAITAQLRAIPLIESLFCEVNPIPIKQALNLKGFKFGEPRLPLLPFTEENTEKLKRLMYNFDFVTV